MSNELKDALYEYNIKRSYNFVGLVINLIILTGLLFSMPTEHFVFYWFVYIPAVFIFSGLVFHLFSKLADKELEKEKNT